MDSSNGQNGNGNSLKNWTASAAHPEVSVDVVRSTKSAPTDRNGRNGNGGRAYARAVAPAQVPASSAALPKAVPSVLIKAPEQISRSRRFERSLTLAELVADFVTSFVVLSVLVPFFLHVGPLARSFAICGSVAILFVIMLDRTGVYRPDNSLLRVRETERVLRASVETYILMVFAAAAMLRGFSGILAVTLIAVLLVATIALEKQLVFVGVRALHAKNIGVRRVVIFGAGSTGRRVFSTLARSPKLGFDPVAIVDEDPMLAGERVFEASYTRTRSVKVIDGKLTSELLRKHSADLVIIAIPSLARDKFLKVLNESVAAGVEVAFVPSTQVPSEFWIEHADVDGLLLASIGLPSERRFYAVMKRLFDVVASLVIAILATPLWITIALLIRFDSPGAAIFVQRRIGKNGKPFNLYKFRTMYVESPAYHFSPRTCTDSRITKVGRLLRRTSLDELPQLLNIIRGEMSLVGPRPEMPFIVEQYQPMHRQRLRVKPGLTGLWQLSADRAFLIHENLEYDLYYVRNRNFFMDLAILLHTAFFAMRGV